MNERFNHLLELLQYNRKSPSHSTFQVFVVFNTSFTRIEFQATNQTGLHALVSDNRGPIGLGRMNKLHPDLVS